MPFARHLTRILVASALPLAAVSAAAQPIPLGDAFLAHEDDALDQTQPQIGVSASDAFLIVWEDVNTPAGHGVDVIGRKFLADGTPLAEFEVQQAFSGAQDFPRLAMNGSGDFAVTWRGQANQDGGRQIKVRNSTSNGTVLGSEEQANENFNDVGALSPRLCVDADDSFAVTWDFFGPPRFRIFATAGNPITGDLDATDNPDADRPAIGCLADGRKLVVWDAQDGAGRGIIGRFYSETGEPLTDELQLNEEEAGNQTSPLVAGVESGGFVVAWVEQGATDNRIEFRRFDSDGTPLTGDRLVVSTVVALPGLSALVAAPDGAFVVAWGGATLEPRVAAAEFTRIGTPLPGGPTVPTEDLSATSLTAGVGLRTYALAWQEDGFFSTDAMARRYVRRAIFSDDFETGDTDAWSLALP